MGKKPELGKNVAPLQQLGEPGEGCAEVEGADGLLEAQAGSLAPSRLVGTAAK